MISIVDDDEFVREVNEGPSQIAWLFGSYFLLG